VAVSAELTTPTTATAPRDRGAVADTITAPPIYPALDAIPLMPEEQLQALAEHIRQHGQGQRIRLHQGAIIDGDSRDRDDACREAGVEPVYEDLTDEEVGNPLAHILSAYLRLDLSQSQRACVIVKLNPATERDRASKNAQD
jgi:hypothetical protein